jgi:hypothetical protein
VSFGIPRKIERLVKMTLEGAQAKVIVDGKISALFTVDKGVTEEDGLSATLFNLTLHKALKKPPEQNDTILNRLTQICGYADDILVIARSLPALEVLCTELTLRLLMSYIYGAPILDVSRSHTTTQHSR